MESPPYCLIRGRERMLFPRILALGCFTRLREYENFAEGSLRDFRKVFLIVSSKRLEVCYWDRFITLHVEVTIQKILLPSWAVKRKIGESR